MNASKEKLQEYYNYKVTRYALLQKRKEQLEDIDIDLFGSKIFRFFGSSYYYFKRVILFILGIVFLLLFLGFTIFPDVILLDEKLEDLIVEGYKSHYEDMTNETLRYSLEKAISSGNPVSLRGIIENLDESLNKVIVEDILFIVRIISILFLVLGIILLYISRQTRKIRNRNKKISGAQSMTQSIISEYVETIKEEEQELEYLEQLLNPDEPSVT